MRRSRYAEARNRLLRKIPAVSDPSPPFYGDGGTFEPVILGANDWTGTEHGLTDNEGNVLQVEG
jgi:hypothetical protein